MVQNQRFLSLFETTVLAKKENWTGTATEQFWIKTGSRIVFTLHVAAIDLGATVTVTIKNGFSVDVPFDSILQVTAATPGFERRILTDFHNQFEIDIDVVGGNASFALGVTVNDNALSTRIENAVIEVDLSHQLGVDGKYDSVRIGDGVDELQIRKAYGQPDDGSVDIHDFGYTKQSRYKLRLLCSHDLKREYVFTEIDGLQRATQIEFTSALLDTIAGAAIKLTRTLTWKITDPYTLEKVEDVLTGVP